MEKNNVAKTTSVNQSAEKALIIVEYLSTKQEPIRLQDMASDLKMNASTLLRFLGTLIKFDYVSQDKNTLKYFLTYKICRIANRITSRQSVGEIAVSYMKQLSNLLDESVCLAIEQSSYVVYIEVVEGPDQIIRTMQRIGNSSPMHCTGVGKLFLCAYTPQQMLKFLTQMELTAFTEHTIVTEKNLKIELDMVRKQGYALDDEECEIGVRCIAVPIKNYASKIVAGISVTGPKFRLTDEKIETVLPVILDTAKRISMNLGYENNENINPK